MTVIVESFQSIDRFHRGRRRARLPRLSRFANSMQDQENGLRDLAILPNISTMNGFDTQRSATMSHVNRWLSFSTAIALLIVMAGNAHAQTKSEKHDAAVLNATLRDVINVGVKLFNDEGDYVGCYRLYQGSLLSVRPFVAPDLQKSIDGGLASAAKMPSFAERALELRRVLDEIRAKTKSPGATTTGAADDGKGSVAGKITFDGKPLAGGYFVTLVSKAGKKFTSAIQKDGTFQFKTPIPTGEYRVLVEPILDEKLKAPPLPQRYGSADTSDLVIGVQTGKMTVDLNLVK
jgi:hypothetical protein